MTRTRTTSHSQCIYVQQDSPHNQSSFSVICSCILSSPYPCVVHNAVLHTSFTNTFEYFVLPSEWDTRFCSWSTQRPTTTYSRLLLLLLTRSFDLETSTASTICNSSRWHWSGACALLGRYATCVSSRLPTFQDSITVPSSRVFLDCLHSYEHTLCNTPEARRPYSQQWWRTKIFKCVWFKFKSAYVYTFEHLSSRLIILTLAL